MESCEVVEVDGCWMCSARKESEKKYVLRVLLGGMLRCLRSDACIYFETERDPEAATY